MLLLDIEEQARNLSQQEKLKLINFLEKDLFRNKSSNGPSLDTDAGHMDFSETPADHQIQAPWSFYEAYDVAANLKEWEKTLSGPKYLDPDKLIYPIE